MQFKAALSEARASLMQSSNQIIFGNREGFLNIFDSSSQTITNELQLGFEDVNFLAINPIRNQELIIADANKLFQISLNEDGSFEQLLLIICKNKIN